jgi:hypothetical protein
MESASDCDYAASGLTQFFIKEAKQYNSLLDRISESITITVDVLNGLRSEDQATRDLFASLQQDITPEDWRLNCYASFSTCSIFIDNLL